MATQGDFTIQYESLPEVRSDLHLPAKVLLNDVTLREGLQAARHPVTQEMKVTIARMLDAVGMPQIQVGYVGRSETDRETLRVLRGEGVSALLEGICPVGARGWREEVEQAIAVAPDRLNLILPSSDFRLREGLNMSREQMLERAVEAVSLARAHCPHVSFSPVDSTRTELSFLKEVLAAVAEAGADRFYLVDTAGVVSPLAMRYLIRGLGDITPIALAVHCHDDFGLAVANGLVAVEEGVEVVDVSMNGMGKRAGNLALEEIALALVHFHDIDLDIRLEGLYDLSEQVARLTGVPVPVNKAIVGRDAFDFHVDAQLRGTAGHPAIQTLDPARVGHPAARASGGGEV